MEELFLKLVNMSITASYLVLALVLLRLLLKKAPKSLICSLWGLVALRLVFPFSIESIFSLIPSSEPLPEEFLYAATPQVNTGIHSLNNAINPVIAESLTPAGLTSANPTQIWSFIFSRIWVIGLVLMSVYAIISYLIVRHRVRVSIKIGRNLRLCDQIDTPFILGILRPQIYLPSNLDQRTADHVLAHEYAHLKRKDHWWKPLGFALLAVYWFNPVIWLAYILLCRDIEMACDEKVVRELDTDHKKAYSEALLQCSVPRRLIAACPLAFGEVGVKNRIKSVLNYRKPAFWVVVVAAVLCIVVAVCFLTDPKTATIDDILNRNGYEILNQSDITFPISIPKSALPDTIYSEEGHDFEPGQVIVSRIGDTTVQLTNVRYSNETPDLMYFSFQFVNEISEAGTIIIHHRLLEGNLSTNNLNVASSLSDENTTYDDALSLRGLDPEQHFTIYMDTAVCQAASGSLNFLMRANAITYGPEGFEPAATEPVLAMGPATYTVDELLAQHAALSSFFGYSDKVITLDNDKLTVTCETDDTVQEFCDPRVTSYGTGGRDELLNQTSHILVTFDGETFADVLDEDFWNQYAGKSMDLLEFYENEEDESPIYSIVCFDGEPSWFVEGSFNRIYALHPASARLAVGTYIPTECIYMNPLSSYAAVNLSEDYIYTVTENGFYTDSFAFICNTNVDHVDWGWKTMTQALEDLKFYVQWQGSEWALGAGPQLNNAALYQKLDDRTHLLLADDALYLIHGGPSTKETELVWGIYKLEKIENVLFSDDGRIKIEIIDANFCENAVFISAVVTFPEDIPISESFQPLSPKTVSLYYGNETEPLSAKIMSANTQNDGSNTIYYKFLFDLVDFEWEGNQFLLNVGEFRYSHESDIVVPDIFTISWNINSIGKARTFSSLEEDVKLTVSISDIYIKVEAYDSQYTGSIELYADLKFFDQDGNVIPTPLGPGSGSFGGGSVKATAQPRSPWGADVVASVMIGDIVLYELMVN